MNSFEEYYIQRVQNYTQQGMLPQRYSNLVIASVRAKTGYQCFHFIVNEIVNRDNTISDNLLYKYQLLWYGCMSTYVPEAYITSYTLMKLFLADLIFKEGDSTCIEYFWKLDKSIPVPPDKIADAMKKSSYAYVREWSNYINDLWIEWNNIVKSIASVSQL